MEIEQVLERLIAWVDQVLSDPTGVNTVEQLLTAADQWLKADIARRNGQQPQPASAPYTPQPMYGPQQPTDTSQQPQRPAPLPPRAIRGAQNSTAGMKE